MDVAVRDANRCPAQIGYLCGPPILLTLSDS